MLLYLHGYIFYFTRLAAIARTGTETDWPGAISDRFRVKAHARAFRPTRKPRLPDCDDGRNNNTLSPCAARAASVTTTTTTTTNTTRVVRPPRCVALRFSRTRTGKPRPSSRTGFCSVWAGGGGSVNEIKGIVPGAATAEEQVRRNPPPKGYRGRRH